MEYYAKLAGKPTKSRLFEWPQFWEHLSNLKKKSKELSKHGEYFRVPNKSLGGNFFLKINKTGGNLLRGQDEGGGGQKFV